LFGGGDATRIAGASKLAVRRWDWGGIAAVACWMFLGITGTGGASIALGTGDDRDGDGSRNVRSDIDPELPLRCS